MPGIGELIIILVIILIVFGAGKLPQIGDALGRSIRNFKRASSGSDEVEVGPKAEELSSDRAKGSEPKGSEPKASEGEAESSEDRSSS
jgi:sec-independent protein translocase protein TatA